MNSIPWRDADGYEFSNDELKKEIIEYSKKGGTIFVGSDSMLNHVKDCTFATVIAFHNRDLDVAKYYFKRFKEEPGKYRELQVKILKEVEIAIQAAQFVLNVCPEADVELHIDIGLRAVNKTSKYFNVVKGWVTGAGFDLRVKPEGWASSLADGHTKGNKKNGNKNKKTKKSSRKDIFKQ